MTIDDHRVDHVAAVIDRDVLAHVDCAGIRVDFDHADMRAERPCEVGRVEVAHRFEALLHPFRQPGAVARERDLAQGLCLFGTALDMEAALVEDDVGFVGFEHMSRQPLGLVDHLDAGHTDRHTTHRQASAAIGAVTHGRSFGGVAMSHLNRFVRNAERVRHDLGERRVMALAMRVRPHIDGDAAGGMDAYLRRLDESHTGRRRGRCARPEPADLDPRRYADAEVATLLAQSFLLATKVFVVGELERLVERLVVVP